MECLESLQFHECVAHVLVVRTLGVKDFIQCLHSSTGCAVGPSGRWPSGVHLLTRPFLPVLVRLLVRVPRGVGGAVFVPPMRSWARSSVVM
jgi:hypothetical protein